MQSNVRTVLWLFFLSGAAGLMYEVSWARRLGQFMGNTAHAQAVVIGVFMAGLALGSVWLGRVGDASRWPLRLYALLELGIGAYGLLFPSLVGVISELYVRAASAVHLEGMQLAWLRLLIGGTMLFVPTVLMGGTLPVLSRFLVRHTSRTREGVARLYYVNSFGAVAGCLAAGFALIHLIGVSETGYVAAGINLAVALVAWSLPAGVAPAAAARSAENEMPSEASRLALSQSRCVLLLLFLSGFAAMIYEVCFIRMIAIGFGSTEYSFAVMVAAFIGGITIGSAVIGRLKIERPVLWLGLVQWGITASFLLLIPIYGRCPYLAMQLRALFEPTAVGFYACELAKLAGVFASVALPTALMGMTFPLVAHIRIREPNRLGRAVGGAYGCNTLGNLMGAICGAVWLIPWLGLERTFATALLLNFLAGALVFGSMGEWAAARRVATILAGVCLCGLALSFHRGWSVPINHAVEHLRVRTRDQIPSNFEKYLENYVIAEPIFFEEDANVTVVVYDHDGERELTINSKSDASRRLDLETQLLLAHIPLTLRPDTQRLLVVGLGSGITSGAALQHPIAELDVVEISPSVARAAGAFEEDNDRALRDPRLRLHIEDATAFLKTTRDEYDTIISEPSNPWMAGVGSLFSTEFFADCLARLRREGTMIMWFHLYEVDDFTLKLTARTFLEVFPHVTLWSVSNLDIALLGSLEPLQTDWSKIESRFADPRVARSLERIEMFDLATLLARYCSDDAPLRKLIGDGSVNTQLHPRLDFLAPQMFFRNEWSFLLLQHYERLYVDGRLPPLLADYARYRPLADEGYARIARQLAIKYPDEHPLRVYFSRKQAQSDPVRDSAR